MRGKLGGYVAMVLLCVCAFTGCAWDRRSSVHLAAGEVFLLPVPFVRQEPGQCAVAALSAAFDYLNIAHDGIEQIFDPQQRGTKVVSLLQYSNQYTTTRVQRLGYAGITGILQSGRPLIILRKENNTYHYMIVKGFIPSSRKLIVNDGYLENVAIPGPEAESGVKADIAIIFAQSDAGAS